MTQAKREPNSKAPDEGAHDAPPVPVKNARARTAKGTLEAFRPTNDQRQLVMLGAAMGLTHPQIAKQINFPAGIDEKTLRKYFADELEHGAARIMAMVAGNLVKIAIDPTHPKAVSAAIFMLKARMGWRDSSDVAVNVVAQAQAGEGAAVAGAQVTVTKEEFKALAKTIAQEI
jgi:hypothetical protein